MFLYYLKAWLLLIMEPCLFLIFDIVFVETKYFRAVEAFHINLKVSSSIVQRITGPTYAGLGPSSF